ncbi:ArsR family transcriptional regulator [Schinkia azotoformans]|uniref:ArsR family transcriptional regulator n=1 Tax=Schinkia azotoformans TaxID=1454 RepID=UPI002E1C3ADD|nr:ArsR family transcriptional regulator [Schinkia azotoformans]
MLEHLITSKTRIKLLLKFFLNPNTQGYLRGLAEEFNESTNAIRVELNRLTEANLLESKNEGRTKIYQANQKHALYTDLHNIVKKFLGIDQIIDEVVKKLGNVDLALITGDYANGIDSGIIDLVIVGEIDQTYLRVLVEKSEALIHRKIRTLVLKDQKFVNMKDKFKNDRAIVVWNSKGE